MSDQPIYEEVTLVADAVMSSERELDDSILAICRLMGNTIVAQRSADIQPAISQPLLAKLNAAMGKALESRNMVCEAHLDYGRLAARFGATPTSWGYGWPCPPPPPPPSSQLTSSDVSANGQTSKAMA